MTYYRVLVSKEYGWVMYYGSAAMFDWLVEFLARRLPGMDEGLVRKADSIVSLHLTELPPPQYQEALTVLAREAVPAAQDALSGPLAGVFPMEFGVDTSLAAVGDVKTIALIARNLLARTS